MLAFLHEVPRYDAIVFVVALGLVVRILAPVSGRALLTGLLGCGVIFAIATVLHLWSVGHEGRSAILFGIYPYSDAGQFYSDTQRLLVGLPFESASRRPLHAALTTALLRLSGNDLRVALMTWAVFLGLATGLYTYEAKRLAGTRVAFVVFAICAFFQRRFAGFIATEAMGFCLAAPAFVLLVRAAQRFERASFGVGLFALSLALLARAGPMFVVPAVLAWGTLQDSSPRERAKTFGVGTLAVAVATLANGALGKRVSSGVTFFDLPSNLYAALHRGNFEDLTALHPSVLALPPEQRFIAMMRIVGEDAWTHPMLVVKSVAASVVGFFTSPHGAFSYVWTNPDDHVLEDGSMVKRLIEERGITGPLSHWVHEQGVYSLLNAAVMGALGGAFAIVLAISIAKLVRRRTQPVPSLLLFVIAGLLLSVPFTPIWVTESCQTQAAVLAFVALAVGVSFTNGATERPPSSSGLRVGATVGLALAFGLIAMVVTTHDAPPHASCERGTFEGRVDPSTRLAVAESGPGASMTTLKTNALFLRKHNESFVVALEKNVRGGSVLSLGYDACGKEARLLVGDDATIPRDRAWRSFSVWDTDDPMVVVVRTSTP